VCIYKAEYYQRMAGAGGIRFLRYMQRFTHNKGLPALYIQILTDNKGLPRSYIQTGSVVVERTRTVGVVRAWWQVPSASSGQAPRQARDRLFDCASRWDRDASLRMTGGSRQRLSVWKQLKVFKRSHPQNRARHKTAPLSIRLVSMLSGGSTVGCVRGHLSARISICGSPSQISEARCGAPSILGRSRVGHPARAGWCRLLIGLLLIRVQLSERFVFCEAFLYQPF